LSEDFAKTAAWAAIIGILVVGAIGRFEQHWKTNGFDLFSP